MLSEKDKEEFQQLIQKYLTGKASPEEKDFVESYYQYPGFDNKEIPPVTKAMEEELFQRLAARLDEPEFAKVIHLQQDVPATPEITVPTDPVTDRKRRLRSPATSRRLTRFAAAAALLLLIGSTWLYFSPHHDQQMANARTKQQDVTPGGSKATLTLGDGRVVVLDSAGNGQLAQQGQSTVKKLSNGQLAYVPQAGNEDKVLYNTLSTPIGGGYKLTLPDGTRVWLNSASSIRYPTAFTGSERRVFMTGEAYFEVKEDAQKPFYTVTRGASIHVLGTRYNVMAYEDENSVNTTLVEGKVKVSSDKASAMLRPGQQAIINAAGTTNNNGVIEIKEADIDKETAWIDGFFQFDQTNLSTLMRQLKRWYGIEAVYRGGDTSRLFGGRISRNMNLSQVIQLLQGNGIHFNIEGKKLIILP
jgi:ferric-dicitrate binding protein FerR (iron transport regulator)